MQNIERVLEVPALQTEYCFVIEKGEPYEVGTRIYMENEEVYLGRSSGTVIANISFSNILISRRHCCITLNGREFTLRDLGSKHATAVNGKRIIPNEPYLLTSGDRIELAMGVAVVRFVPLIDFEETMDFSWTHKLVLKNLASIVLDVDKRECKIDGQPIWLSEKEWKLLKLLYEKSNKLVPYDEIKSVVWIERNMGKVTMPADVGTDEINILIYRLRKKMGQRGTAIKTIRACGCILEV